MILKKKSRPPTSHFRMLAQKKTWPKRAIQKRPNFLALWPKKIQFLDHFEKKKGQQNLLASQFFSLALMFDYYYKKLLAEYLVLLIFSDSEPKLK